MWDEFKVQVQTEEWPLFPLYVEEITRHCLAAVCELPRELQALLWLAGEGASWRLDEEFNDEVPFGQYLEDELAQELYGRIWSIAADEEVVGGPWDSSQLGELS